MYYQQVVRRYKSELGRIARLYEQQKRNPPLQRSVPPVAGHIEWSRQLFRRIAQPMQLFEKEEKEAADAAKTVADNNSSDADHQSGDEDDDDDDGKPNDDGR